MRTQHCPCSCSIIHNFNNLSKNRSTTLFTPPPKCYVTIKTPQVWVEDDETFAADPYVALPWGMSGLSLPHIVSLTRTLRRSFAGAEGDAGGTILMPVSELSSAVRTWSHSERIESNGDGEREDIPRAWTGPSSGYIETLCGAIAGGVNTDKVSWRR